MPRARNFPTDALQGSLHTLVANVNRPHAILREIAGDMHAFPHKSRPQLSALELRINHQQIAKADPAPRFMRVMRVTQNLPPNTVPGRLTIPLSNQYPIRPTGKGGTYPFAVNLRRSVPAARDKILQGQAVFLDRLEEMLREAT
jgi:hypothetical protein